MRRALSVASGRDDSLAGFRRRMPHLKASGGSRGGMAGPGRGRSSGLGGIRARPRFTPTCGPFAWGEMRRIPPRRDPVERRLLTSMASASHIGRQTLSPIFLPVAEHRATVILDRPSDQANAARHLPLHMTRCSTSNRQAFSVILASASSFRRVRELPAMSVFDSRAVPGSHVPMWRQEVSQRLRHRRLVLSSTAYPLVPLRLTRSVARSSVV